MRSVSAPITIQKIFGVEVLSCHFDRACDLIEARIADRVPTRIAFLNANLSLLAFDRPELREALKEFVVLNDGLGVDIANRVLNGSKFPANLNGTDLVPHLLGHIRYPLRIFLLGSKPETLQRAASAIRRRWPRHVVVGQADGYFDVDHEVLIVKAISDARPDVVLVAMGNPKQELWIAHNVPHCAPCALGVGALLEFLSGDVKRAPRWIRAARFEWAFRLAVEPGRLWRRYLIGNARFLAYVAALWTAQRVGSAGKRASDVLPNGSRRQDRGSQWRKELDRDLVSVTPALSATVADPPPDAPGASRALTGRPV